MIALVQRGSPLEEDFGCFICEQATIYYFSSIASVVVTNLLGSHFYLIVTGNFPHGASSSSASGNSSLMIQMNQCPEEIGIFSPLVAPLENP